MQSSRPLSGGGLPEEHWERLRGQLEQSMARVCPHWMVDRRDDLVQVAMMRVLAIQKKSEGNRELRSSYLSRVAYSALVDEIRRLKRRSETPLDDEDGEGSRTPAPLAGPETTSMGREVGRGIRDCLALQVSSRRLAVTLNLQGYSVPEAARQLQWTVKKTENLVYRGMADLRQCLEKKGLRP